MRFCHRGTESAGKSGSGTDVDSRQLKVEKLQSSPKDNALTRVRGTETTSALRGAQDAGTRKRRRPPIRRLAFPAYEWAPLVEGFSDRRAKFMAHPSIQLWVNRSSWGTRGQLVEVPVAVQLVYFHGTPQKCAGNRELRATARDALFSCGVPAYNFSLATVLEEACIAGVA
jgi:hypothetical protein